MRFNDLVTLLKFTLPAKLPVLVEGDPGLGKTAAIHYASTQVAARVLISNPGVDDISDAKGIPAIIEGKATFMPFGQLRDAINSTQLTVWFWDDFGQGMQQVQNGYMQLLGARGVDIHRLPEHVVIVAATNNRRRDGVAPIIEPVLNRFHTIVKLDAHVDDTVAYGQRKGWHPLTTAYLQYCPDHLSMPRATTTGYLKSPSPRVWEHFDALYRLGLPAAIQRETFGGALGDAAVAGQVLTYAAMFASLTTAAQVFADPRGVAIPAEPSERYALCAALAHAVTPKTAPAFAVFAERLLASKHGSFAALLITDAVRRHGQAFTDTPAYVGLATGKFATLLTGRAAA